jgi:Transcriptional regulators
MPKTPTIDDLAVALGMHKSTVSKALSGKGNISRDTRARVRDAARALGYEPNPLAQRLASGFRNPTVHIFSGTLDLGMATQKIRLIQQALSAQGWEVSIHASPEAPSSADAGGAQAAQVRHLCRQRPRAVVCAAQMVDPEVFGELEQYQRDGGIVVSYDAPVPLACDQVIFDREDNAYRAARHLLERGHRRLGLGMSRKPLWLEGVPGTPQAERFRGFLRALDEYGVAAREEWLFENPPYEEGGEEMARRFLALTDRPTGLCIVNDYVAFAFMVDVTRAGLRVPEDVSIISHDDQPITSRCPVPMTSLSQPAGQIAHEVVTLLNGRASEGYDGPPRVVIVRGDLTVRASVGPPPPLA